MNQLYRLLILLTFVSCSTTETINQPNNKSNDLKITKHWFFTGPINDEYKSSFFKSDAKSIKQGQCFGIRVFFQTTKEKVQTKLILTVPKNVQNFPFDSETANVKVSDDQTTVTIEDDISLKNDSFAIYLDNCRIRSHSIACSGSTLKT